MNILYLVKHFPSLSQTFVLNEVRALMARGCQVHVVSAIDLHEPIALEPELAARVFYLRHGSLYRYGAEVAQGFSPARAFRIAQLTGASRLPPLLRGCAARHWSTTNRSACAPLRPSR